MSANDKEFINMDNTRLDEQRAVMQEIAVNEECPFCPENLDKYHKAEILRKGAHWLLTHNQWPYEHTDLHLMAIATHHATNLSELRAGAFGELQDHFTWAEREFRIRAGAIAMRFGDIRETGATVNHLHAQLLVPAKDIKPEAGEHLRFRMSKKKS